MNDYRAQQGTILSFGITLITLGGTLAVKGADPFSVQCFFAGLGLLAVGAGLVFWRESRKE